MLFTFSQWSQCKGDNQLDSQNYCANVTCENSAPCEEASSSFVCVCPVGFTGQFCEAEIDGCADGPCVNGGTCTADADTYTCTCANAYTGVNCETDTASCRSDSDCENSGTCVSLNCECVDPYTVESNCMNHTRRVSGRLRMPNEPFTPELATMGSSAYNRLAAIVRRLENQCSRTSSFSNINSQFICTIVNLVFSEGSVVANYDYSIIFPPSMPVADVDDYIEDLFNAISEAAENDELLVDNNGNPIEVNPNSLELGPHDASEDDGLSDGEIIGIAVGGFVFLVIVIVIIFLCLYVCDRRNRRTAGHPREKGFYQDTSSTSSSYGVYNRRPNMLMWQKGHMAHSIGSVASYGMTNERPRNGDRLVAIERFGKDGRHEYREFESTHHSHKRRGQHDDRYTSAGSVYSGSSARTSATNRWYDNYAYRGSYKPQQSRYHDFYNSYPSYNYNYDMGRLRNIGYAFDNTRPIDWSAMRNFASRRQGYGNQLWQQEPGSTPTVASWDWNAY